MELIIAKNYDEISDKASEIFIELIKRNPEAKLGLATGSSPLGLYQRLIQAYNKHEISFKQITTFNLDEYVGISRNHPQSYFSFMNENLFKHIDIDLDHVHLPDNDLSKIDTIAKDYNKLLRKNPIDLQVLGIGSNGHIGFNEPGTPLGNETFVVELDEQTRNDNSRFFGHVDLVPTHAITMGIKNIMRAKHIILIASGKEKSDAIYQMLYGEVTTDLPASVLQLHPNCTVIIDEEAARLLP
ncbi:MAG: glucosamine-6-phosphate deaminase [Acholeplasmataceae bacterium]|jgi:glucosamine-6-phosphate deaminase|nr:glucosamine-6-phosphate deaminase [Acholeplasmataceae bacterium]